MKRELMITAGAAATLAAALAGCSHHDGTVRAGNAAVAPAGSSNTKVLVDGKDQNVKGQVACTTAAGTVNIAIGGGSGSGGAPTGIGAVLTDANPLVVKSVALGNVNGVSLGVGGTSGKADATKDGSTYKISGTASGVDMSNPMAGPVNKSFELDVTCP
ncbi:lipoprotein LpqH [Mycobacterium cookii]|uniref:Lipoprotein LpqH n=1 Tax=Mycobacterium cookii TaxID=1775 RepID=A0A7I7L0C8_9MYCO|nr:lipoprotein LpqH [Mycobacterium cookii]MCV7329674.1 lipoprotein LpqH [Mycobacterium cookii]BBX47815.1 lipoprotein LpqH [Mycobacterium cookii]